MTNKPDPRGKAALAHTAFVLSSLLGDRICGIPHPDESGHDEYLDDLLDDVDQVRMATGRLIDLLCAEYPAFAGEYARHEQRMKEAANRRDYARQLLRLAGEDPDGEDEKKGGAQ